MLAGDLQGRGMSRRVVGALLASAQLQNVEGMCVMTANKAAHHKS